jgi:hypothetical protein
MGTKYHSAMARRGSALVVATVCLLAACSSGDVDVAETTSVTLTVPSSIDVPATTNAPTTSESPTTTIDPADALAAEVEADFREADRLGREASMDPFDAAKEEAALEWRLGVIAENFAAKLADWRERNYALRENPDVPASITVEVPAALVLEGADVAEMQICEVNPWLVVEVGAGPNGTDALVDPEVVSSRARIFMREVGGAWRFEGSSLIGQWAGESACPLS